MIEAAYEALPLLREITLRSLHEGQQGAGRSPRTHRRLVLIDQRRLLPEELSEEPTEVRDGPLVVVIADKAGLGGIVTQRLCQHQRSEGKAAARVALGHPHLKRSQLAPATREVESRHRRERPVVPWPPDIHAQPVLHMPEEFFPVHRGIVAEMLRRSCLDLPGTVSADVKGGRGRFRTCDPSLVRRVLSH